ncbi:hypothetical protein [Isoptericola sp. NPDC056605]|uniref:hypothetical protein n=1 Tax=Isoptericola sp. NPDC056605 TaxID=3345876 RepID=UPI0036C40049
MPLNIKRARRVIPFYPDSAVAAEIEAASDALVAAKKAAGDRLASKAVREAQTTFDDATKRGQSSVLDIELEALSRKRWAEIEESNRPREDDKVDEGYSLNWDTFLAEALPESVRSVKEHASGDAVEVSAAEWVEALDEISDGQYTTLALNIIRLNRDGSRPF